MKTRIPGKPASLGRSSRMIWVTSSGRLARGVRWKNMRPKFWPPKVAADVPPTLDMNSST